MPNESWSSLDAEPDLHRALLASPSSRLVRADLRQSRENERAAQVAMTQEAIARVFKVPVSELRAPTRRTAPVAEARQIAMYLTHVVFGLSLSGVGRHFGRDRTTAAHVCRQIEDRRDDHDFDVLVDRLEFAIRSLPLGGLRQ
ncbi:MAG: helix-turn-helix domain-containing protein [Pseudomonadota bacterium]